MKQAFRFVVLAMMAIWTGGALAQPLDLEAALGLKAIRSPVLAPDGSHVAFLEFHNDFENDKDMSQLWVAPLDGGDPLQLTFGEESVSSVTWSGDGTWLAFMRGDDLYLMRRAGGEAIKLDLDVSGIGNVAFAPDDSALYFTAGPGDKAAMEARKEKFGDYTVVREDGAYKHLWRQPLSAEKQPDGDPVQLTDGRDFSVVEFALAPDGKTIAFATWSSPALVDLLNGALHTIPADGGDVTTLDDSPGVKAGLVWRRDGQRLAYVNGEAFPRYGDIVIIDPDGDKRMVIDMPDLDPELVRFEGDGLFLDAGEGAFLGHYRVDVSSGEVSERFNGHPFVAATQYNDEGTVAAFLTADSGTLVDLTVVTGGESRRLTRYAEQLDGYELPQQELIRWTNDVGQEIEGVLTKPVGFDASKTYPLYVRTHGGPTGTDRPWMAGMARSIYAPAVLAAEGGGALVLQTNYRGSASYGEAFQTSNRRLLGVGPARDIVAGVEMLVDSGMVDPQRVACLGWSQGGHISAMLATYTDICSAAIMGAGISDWRTYYYNTDITQFTTEYFGATPLADDDVYALTSPVTYIDRAKTPVLIQHGENDARVPIANGYQLRQLLQDKGVPARMIVYSGMGHGPSSPRTRRAISQHALDWFRHHIHGATSPDFVHPIEPVAAGAEDNPSTNEE